MSLHSEQACQEVLQAIIARGSRKARDNQTIKKHLHNYIAAHSQDASRLMLGHAGEICGQPVPNRNRDVPPSSMNKDSMSHCSALVSAVIRTDQPTNRTQKTSRVQRHEQKKMSQTFAFGVRGRGKPRVKEESFVKLFEASKDSNRRPTHQIIEQEERINQLRMGKQEREIDESEKEKARYAFESTQSDKFKQKQVMLQKFLREKTNSFAFEDDGLLILRGQESQRRSLRKVYPPKPISYDLEEQEDPSLYNAGATHIKEKAARGQAFASAVLKTVNMSKISMNMTANIGQDVFMQRNDLFNNNHCRQVTNIPYLEVAEGSTFTQAHNNLSVSMKSTNRTCHSTSKSRFKKHQWGQKENGKQTFECGEQEEKKRVQSSRPYIRPKSCVPYSARTTGRIMTANKELMVELIE